MWPDRPWSQMIFAMRGISGGDEGREGSAYFETCETEFRFSRCIRQGSVEAPPVIRKVAKYVLWQAEEK